MAARQHLHEGVCAWRYGVSAARPLAHQVHRESAPRYHLHQQARHHPLPLPRGGGGGTAADVVAAVQAKHS